jgi:hypothetical protein
MGGGAQRPVGRGNEPKKTGARSARARTRGQNPLVKQICETFIKKTFSVSVLICLSLALFDLAKVAEN